MDFSIRSEYISSFEVKITLTTSQGETRSIIVSSELAQVLVPTIISGSSMWMDDEFKLVEDVVATSKHAFAQGD